MCCQQRRLLFAETMEAFMLIGSGQTANRITK